MNISTPHHFPYQLSIPVRSLAPEFTTDPIEVESIFFQFTLPAIDRDPLKALLTRENRDNAITHTNSNRQSIRAGSFQQKLNPIQSPHTL